MLKTYIFFVGPIRQKSKYFKMKKEKERINIYREENLSWSINSNWTFTGTNHNARTNHLVPEDDLKHKTPEIYVEEKQIT